MPSKQLRRPFVLTVAVSAISAAAACGGSTSGDGSGGTGGSAGTSGSGSGGSAGSSGSGASAGTGGKGFCPSAFPVNGAACDLANGTTCSFPQGSCCPPWQASCVDGSWQSFPSSCNPPPPLPCPAAVPKQGEACGSSDPCGNDFQYCTYQTCADGTPRIVAQCDGTSWQVQTANCALPSCQSLSACECFERSDCRAMSDDCLCPCDFMCPGTPPCDCACGGGKYLGCEAIVFDAGTP